MTAWDVLLRCKIGTLPVDLGRVCRELGIGLYSYTQGYEILRRYGLARYARGADGFLFREEDGALAAIFYNPHQPGGAAGVHDRPRGGTLCPGALLRWGAYGPAGGGQPRRPGGAGSRPIRLPAAGPGVCAAGAGAVHALCHPAGLRPEHPGLRGVRCTDAAAPDAGRPVDGGAWAVVLFPIARRVEALPAIRALHPGYSSSSS